MRIAYLADAGSVHTRRFASYFVETGWEVHVISFRDATLPGASVHHVPPPLAFKLLAYPLTVPRVSRLLRRLRPDIVHAHYVSSYGLVAALTGYHPLIVTAWGSDVLLTPQASPLMGAVVGFALRRADVVGSLAHHMTRRIRQFGVPDHKIVTKPFGVDTGQCHPGLRLQGVEDTDIVCTRAFEPIYNVELLIRALPLLGARLPGMRCVLVGGGSLEEDLRRLARSLHVDGHIRWAGQVTPETVPAWLARSRVFVSVSLSDGNNVSLNEAMACGAFPVVSDIPANQEWIVDGENGLRVPVDDPAALAQGILRALGDVELRRRAAEQNWMIVRARADWRNHVSEMEQKYRDLLAAKCRAQA